MGTKINLRYMPKNIGNAPSLYSGSSENVPQVLAKKNIYAKPFSSVFFYIFILKTSTLDVHLGHPRCISTSAKKTVSRCNAFSIGSSWSYSSKPYRK